MPPLLRFKRMLPRGLFGRTLLIIVLPSLLTLAAATYIFFDRHWTTITNRLTYSVAGDVATIIELMRSSTTPESVALVTTLADAKMDLVVSFHPGESLVDNLHPSRAPIAVMLKHALHDRLPYRFNINMHHASEIIAIQVGTEDGVYTVLCPQRRVYTPTSEIFIFWMAGSSILLTGIALLFMRNQVRPIRRLAQAAEEIGKGRDVLWFRLEGAAEVRQAGAALMVMRDRLRRQISQRTAMLAGVSHDLRTPLTRMRLQLELMPETKATAALNTDVSDMEQMLDGYLAFARGEEAEPSQPIDLEELVAEVAAAARRQDKAPVIVKPFGSLSMTLRYAAMKRCLSNLVGNAVRYGKHAEISVVRHDHLVDIMIDDPGPGIPPDMREDMFRPFTRMEESRNSATGGVGLGLAIARDIARAHGGDIILEDSPLGGLRARLWLPM